ncbi:F-box domain containing protein [Pandoravirus neocaledonia]|uniref:F-box domain containing protein n=1 Tax=Pandoravirus neocaledonia TaxID=2107708 RepID=A0A2U7UCY1_9VIRU|nr:F-box domain containing protein [Pandoravirus neocaledonia]AVK76329.1 F-box domain containing protein [Pandoravirus neocaledonia]
MSSSPIDALFIELIQRVCAMVDKEDRPAFRRVCHKWRDAASSTRGGTMRVTDENDAADYVAALDRLGRLSVPACARWPLRMANAACSTGHATPWAGVCRSGSQLLGRDATLTYQLVIPDTPP